MKVLVRSFLALSMVLALGQLAHAKCGDDPADGPAVAAARAQVEIDCVCASFTNHGQYVKCAKTVAIDRANAMTLPKNCKGSVIKCAAKSTCGKPGFVTCCRTSSAGTTKCSTKPDATKCKAPSGGSACVSIFSSCCDACTASGCASPSGAFLDGPVAAHF